GLLRQGLRRAHRRSEGRLEGARPVEHERRSHAVAHGRRQGLEAARGAHPAAAPSARRLMKTILAAASVALAGMAQAADIAVLASPAMKEAYVELVPRFERSSGNRVTTTWAGTADIMKRMQARDEAFDVVIAAASSLDELTDSGRLVAGSRKD